MIFIAAQFQHTAQQAAETLKLERSKWKYLYAHYLLNGFRGPTVYLTPCWDKGKSPEELLQMEAQFIARSARVAQLDENLEIPE